MSPLARIRQVAAGTLFMACPLLAAAAAPAPPQSPPMQLAPHVAGEIAHSALLTLEGTVTENALQLRIHKVADKSLVSGEGVTVAVDGRSESVSRISDGYEVPLDDLRQSGGSGAGRELEVVVPHDGIREILSGKVALADGGSAGSLLADHKQVAWWILNIVVVLIAAIAISRRKG